ncbi:MAG: hypothetical protein K9J12_04670 [Melioribacteraceae bacterium]|nr:hypothetical protein [Melioribacteraceae bacterium]MCF8265043.1 hypothetical protein [Melioribacteraceae bacterium]MCF8414390.1 hypothetical protein [Melioribacteraceae bacterium]MCF8430966.1 hypothetical protein [Melioribacteraceae bacterium]
MRLKYPFAPTLFAVLLLLISCKEEAAKKEPKQYLLYNVLVDEQNDNYEIFRMNLDGSDKKNISNHKAVDWAYYTSGEKIYFLSDRDTTYRKYLLYEMDCNGENVRRITDFFLHDSWFASRKNESEFVVTSYLDGEKNELYLIDNNGKVLKRLTDNNIYENDPVFSPEGDKIVFRSKESGIDELWIMDSDGSNRLQLTNYPPDDSSIPQHGYHAGPPSWEPNHNFISYPSKQNGNYSIFAIDPDGENLRQITPDSTEEIYHSWSYDGKYLAYDGNDETGNYDIFLMDFASKNVTQLTKDSLYEGGPVFLTLYESEQN